MAIKSQSTQYRTITGITTVNHQIRVKLRLSMADYAILTMIEDLKGKEITDSIAWKRLGVTFSIVTERLIFLCTEGFLDHKYKLTDKWFNAFLPDESEEKFNKLWETFERTGNKKAAKTMFQRALKVEQYDVLLKKAEEYIAFCNKTNRFVMHMSSWLNPDFQHWNDQLQKEAKKKTVDTGPIQSKIYNG